MSMEHILSSDEMFDEDTIENKYLIFSIDKEIYGIMLGYVFEIVGMQEITHVPRLPAYLKGIINVRGNIVPVMDLRVRFKKELQEFTDRHSIIIITFEEVTLGLIVDKAIEVSEILQEEILSPPELVTGYRNEFVRGVCKKGDSIRLLIDCEKLLSRDEITEILSEEYEYVEKN